MESTNEKFSAQWAIDLLEPTEFDRSNHILKYYEVPICAFTFGCVTPALNKMRGLPMTMNAPYTVLSTMAGALLGYVLTNLASYKFARKNEMMRDYIRSHPECFPEPENRKYADILLPWSPSR